MTESKRRRVLDHTDQLLDHIERAMLRGRGRRRVPDATWEALAHVADVTTYPPDPPDTWRACHRYLLGLQGARLLRSSAPAHRVRVAGLPKGWKTYYLPDPIDTTSATWWEGAEAVVERLEARWRWAATWARRDPRGERLAALEAAWANYYAEASRLAQLARPAARRAA